MAGFTGMGDGRDDDVDVTSYAAMIAQSLRGTGSGCSLPELAVPGRGTF